MDSTAQVTGDMSFAQFWALASAMGAAIIALWLAYKGLNKKLLEVLNENAKANQNLANSNQNLATSIDKLPENITNKILLGLPKQKR